MRSASLLVAGVLVVAAMGMARAAHPDETWQGVRHVVVLGDTLEALSVRYTGRRTHWPRLQQINAVAEPRRLMPGTVIRVPAELLLPAPATARVLYVDGQANAQARAAAAPVALAPGMDLAEGTRITVGPNGYLRLGFADGSVTALPQGTTMVLERVRRQPLAGVHQTDIRLQSGRADSEVVPRQQPRSHFRIHTPQAVASVRGTRFGVEVRPDASTSSEVLEGRVEISASLSAKGAARSAQTLLSAGQGTHAAATGSLAPPRGLPARPLLDTLPDTFTDADAVVVPLPAADGVAGYRVRIAQDAAMGAVVGNAVVAADGAAAILPPLPDGRYTIGVRAIDALGLHGAEATRPIRIKAHPLPPLLRSPGPRERVRGGKVTLRCAAPQHAARIKLQVAATPDFQQPLVDLQDAPGCIHAATLPPGDYYWRVATVEQRPGQAADEGPYSRAQRFEVTALPQAPAQLAIVSTDAGLYVHWAALPGLRYRVQVAGDSVFARAPLYDRVLQDPQARISDLPPGHYFLRMQALDADGVAGPFSTAWHAQVGRHWLAGDGSPLSSGSGQPVLQAPGH